MALLLTPEAAQRRGDESERRVAEVLVRDRMPWWFIHARKGRRIEDLLGIDFVVYTHDVGRILLQVKSSRAGEAYFHEDTRRYGRLHRIHVVIVRPRLDSAVVLGRVLAACIIAREEAEAAGTTADDVRLCGLAQEAA